MSHPEQTEQSNNPEKGDIFLVVGKGSIGEKAQQLLDKTKDLEEIGFRVPPMTVLAQDFFDDFFQRNSLGNTLVEVPEDKIPVEINEDDFRLLDREQIESLYQAGDKNPKKKQTLNVLQEICQMYNGVLIFIDLKEEDIKGGTRSRVEITDNKTELVVEAIKEIWNKHLANPLKNSKNNETITIQPIVDDRNSIPNKIERASFSQEQINAIQTICQRYGDNPVAVRSSAAGEAGGNGVYTSIITENKTGLVAEAIKEVLASYFTQSAIDFRRDAKTGTGMGVIIEPLIGKRVNQYFFPILSGFGYTSTINSEGYVNINPGFGCAVKGRYSEKITKKIIDQHGGILTKYIRDELSLIKDGLKPYRLSNLLQQFSDGTAHGHGEAFKFSDGTAHGHGEILKILSNSYHKNIEPAVSIATSNDFYEALNDNFGKIFQMMAETEQRFSSPQYFEFAITYDSGKSNFWIIQIADVTDSDKEINYIDFGKTDQTLIEAHSVAGSGTRNISKTVFCFTEKDVDQLLSFNQRNTDYMLVCSSKLIADENAGLHTYEYFSNASVVLQISDSIHAGPAIGHYAGTLAKTGKIFGVFGNKGQGYESIKPNTKEQSLDVYNGNLTIRASSRQNRLIVLPSEIG
jgi:hypothetical protein